MNKRILEGGLSGAACQGRINAVRDALYVINGKWKLLIIVALTEGPLRFNEIERAIEGITPRVLSSQLKELELNEFVNRRVVSSTPIQVFYELTPYSDSFKEIISALMTWGESHKEFIIKKMREKMEEKEPVF